VVSCCGNVLGPTLSPRNPDEVQGSSPRIFLEPHGNCLRDLRIIPEMEPSYVLPPRVLHGEGGGVLNDAPRARKAPGHFLGLATGLDKPSYHSGSFRTGNDPAYLCRQNRLHHFRAEFVNLAEGFRASNTLSHTVRVRLEHRWRFHDGDADRTAGVATNQQEVRHVLTALPGSIGLYGQAAHVKLPLRSAPAAGDLSKTQGAALFCCPAASCIMTRSAHCP
jgi:hypothetical protein